MTGRIDKSTRKHGSQEIAESISLLKHARDEASGLFWAILQRRRRGVSIQATHRNTEEGSAGEELLIGLRKTRTLEGSASLVIDRRGAAPHVPYHFNDDEQRHVDDEGPFSAIPVSRNAEGDGAQRTQHQHERDSPGYIRVGLAERRGQVANGQTDGEEVERIPRLSPNVSHFHTASSRGVCICIYVPRQRTR